VIAGALEIQLFADIARLKADMDKATGVVTAATKSISAAASAATTALAGIASGLVGVAAVNAFAVQVRGAIELADELNKLSQRTGITTEKLSQLRFAAKLADVSNESLTTGLRKLNQAIADGVAGDKAKVEAFRNLNIELKDVNGKVITADQALLKISDRFAKASDGAVKTQYSMLLMGKAGDELIPMLNGGSRALQELMDKADRLGITISSDFGRKAEEFNDNLTILNSSSQRLAITLAGDLVSALGSSAKAAADASEQHGKLAGIMAGLDQLGNKLFDWEGNAQRKGIKRLREEVADAKKQLDAMAASYGSLGRLQQQAVPELAVGVEEATQKYLRLQAALQKVLTEYYKLSDGAAGAGRGVARDPRQLGPVRSIEQQMEELKPLSGGSSGSKTASEYDALIKRVKERVEVTQQELAAGRELTDFEKFQAKVTHDVATAKKDLTAAQKAEIATLLEAAKVKDRDVQVMRGQVEQARQLAVARQQARNADYEQSAQAAREIQQFYQERARSVNETVKSLVDERAALELSVKANISLAEAVERVSIARTRQEQSRVMEGGEVYEQLQREIEAREKLATLMKDRSDFERLRDVWREVDRSAQDAFTNIFEGGRDAFTRLRDTLKATLLQLLYQMTVRRWIINVSAQVGGGGNSGLAAQSLTSGGGDLSSLLQNNSGLLSAGYQAFTGASVGASGASLAYANTIGALGGDSIGALIAANGGWAGVSAGATTAATTFGVVDAAAVGTSAAAGTAAAAGGVAAGGGGAALAALAAAAPYIAVIAAIGMALAGKRGGPKQEGYFNPYNSDAYYSSNSPGAVMAGQKSAEALQTQYETLLKATGGSASGIKFGAGFSLDKEGDAPSQAHIGAGRDGQALFNLHNTDIGRDDADLQAAIAQLGAQAVLKALQHSNIGGKIGEYLHGLGDAANLSADQVTAAIVRIQRAGEERMQLEDTWYQLTHNAIDNLAHAREKELAALDESNRAMAQRIYSLQDAIANTDRYYGTVQTLGEEQVNQLQSIMSVLVDAITSINGAATASQLGRARGVIGSALSAARAGGALPDADSLAEAVGILRDSLMPANFGSQLEYDLARKNVVNNLQELEDYADGQLTATEQTLAYWKQQIEIARGTYEASISMAEALSLLAKAFGVEVSTRSGGLPSFASGGDHLGGWAVVGEHGRELVWMPRSHVFNASETTQILGGGGGRGGGLNELRGDLRDGLAQVAVMLSSLYKLHRKWDVDGTPAERIET
jgi:hypothetical protein